MLCGLLALATKITIENRQLLNDSAASLVLFTVSEQNCPPCNELEILLNELNIELPIYVVDCDQLSHVCQKAKLQTVPRLSLFKNGHEVINYDESYTKQAITEFAQRIAAPLFVTQPATTCYFVVESSRPPGDFDDIFLPVKAEAELLYSPGAEEQFYAIREGVRIDYEGKITKGKKLREFVLLHNCPFIQRFSIRNMFALYSAREPLLLITGRHVRDQSLLEFLGRDMREDWEFYGNITIAFLDLQEYAVYTEIYGVNKRQNAVSLVVSNHENGSYYKEMLQNGEIVQEIREIITELRNGRLEYSPFVKGNDKQVKIGVGQSYTPPSETVGDRVLQVLNGMRNYDGRVWAAIISSCCGLILGASALIYGLERV